MNRLIFILILMQSISYGQMHPSALNEFVKGEYTPIENKKDDAVVIFDRTYYQFVKTSLGVDLYITTHRKVHVNTYYGLERYNKLYISTGYSDYGESSLINAKVKTLKKDEPYIFTDTSGFSETTLPANTPFFYKKSGKVKLLAIPQISIGDQVEYIYTIRQSNLITPKYFSYEGFLSAHADDPCKEWKLEIDAKGFNIRITAPEENGEDSKKVYQDASSISFQDLEPYYHERFSSPNSKSKYVMLRVSHDPLPEQFSWKNFTFMFKKKSKLTKHSYVFDGSNAKEISDYLSDLNDKGAIMDSILFFMNLTLEKNYLEVNQSENEINIIWNYAKNISQIVKELEIPVKFYFLTSKYSDKLDTNNVDIFNFDAICMSFMNEDQEIFMPIYRPFAKMNEISSDYFGTLSFCINQTEKGEFYHTFVSFPELNPSSADNSITNAINLNLLETKSDSLFFEITKKMIFQGRSWNVIKPLVKYSISDSVRLERFKNSLIGIELKEYTNIDSTYSFVHSITENSYEFSFKFILPYKISADQEILGFKPEVFISNPFELDYYDKKNRKVDMDFRPVPKQKIEFSVDMNNQYLWLENESLKTSFNNTFGKIDSKYSINENKMKIQLSQSFTKGVFPKENWNEIVKILEESSRILRTKLYFKEN